LKPNVLSFEHVFMIFFIHHGTYDIDLPIHPKLHYLLLTATSGGRSNTKPEKAMPRSQKLTTIIDLERWERVLNRNKVSMVSM